MALVKAFSFNWYFRAYCFSFWYIAYGKHFGLFQIMTKGPNARLGTAGQEMQGWFNKKFTT